MHGRHGHRAGRQFVPVQSVLQLAIGDPIRLGAADFARLSEAFLAEIRSRFL